MTTQIIPRKLAKSLKLKKYYTGEECVHGHIAERHTQSGTCVDCLKESNGTISDPVKDSVAAARASLVEIKVRAYDADTATLRGAATAATRGRYPILAPEHVNPTKAPRDITGGTALYFLRVHPADVELIQGIARVLLNAHGPDVCQAREAILHTVSAQAEAESSPMPAFKP